MKLREAVPSRASHVGGHADGVREPGRHVLRIGRADQPAGPGCWSGCCREETQRDVGLARIELAVVVDVLAGIDRRVAVWVFIDAPDVEVRRWATVWRYSVATVGTDHVLLVVSCEHGGRGEDGYRLVVGQPQIGNRIAVGVRIAP